MRINILTIIERENMRKNRSLKEELQLEIIRPFISISNILQGISNRSFNMENNLAPFIQFNDLYNLLSKESLLIQAYGNIQRNKGSLTPGTSHETVDAMSLNKIIKLAIEIKEKRFKFGRIRRKFILKRKIYKPGMEKRKENKLNVGEQRTKKTKKKRKIIETFIL